MIALVDTDVLVDCLRGVAEAREWASQRRAESFAIPGIAAMELVCGCRDGAALQLVRAFLADFPIVWPTASDAEMANGLLVAYRLSYGIGIADAMIASMAIQRSATLYTFNTRHVSALPGLVAASPYARVDRTDGPRKP